MGRHDDGGQGCLPAALMIIGIVAVLAYLLITQIGTPGQWLTPPEAQVEPRGPAVLKQIRSVNRIETQSYSVDGIYRVGKQSGDANNFLLEDVIVLGARAEIVAGIDLSRLRDEDVVVQDDRVTITLPDSEIFFVRMDNRATRVFDRERGWLVGLGVVQSDPTLESQARSFAEDQLLQDACDRGLLEAAANEGRATMERLMRAMKLKPTIVVNAGPCEIPPSESDRTPEPTERPGPRASATPGGPPGPSPTSGAVLGGTVVVITPEE